MAKRSLLAQNAGHEGWPAPGVQPDAALEGYLLAQPGCLQELQGDLQSCLQGCLQALHQALFGRAPASAHCGPPATGEDQQDTMVLALVRTELRFSHATVQSAQRYLITYALT